VNAPRNPAIACAAVGTGLWGGFEFVDSVHQVQSVHLPIKENVALYKKLADFYPSRELSIRFGPQACCARN
jgi:hypothetical protein